MFTEEFKNDYIADATENRLLRMFEERCEEMFLSIIEGGTAEGICESPIETLLAGAFALAKMKGDFGAGLGLRFLDWNAPRKGEVRFMDLPRFKREMPEGCVCVSPQVEISRITVTYRVDFLMGCKLDDEYSFLAVECDGHDFHEKTRDQASRDKARDRKLLSAGVPIMRFTGSEIWASPVKCVDSLDSYFMDRHFDSYQRRAEADIRAQMVINAAMAGAAAESR